MGKGDLKTKRGKIVNKSYGVRRPKKKKDTSK
ncbi:30S ribosomal protein THX [Myroides albus]|uniref:30S ribosomal protein THX n=1 Tax=Myroides albus TaxID=2562892 RepID=A0A6I3LMC1_9FLAO|nr:30S ribosomal protein THX [Myroides albus]MTG98857.1 30S ribosomal protein THX [Myroides albus]UVD79585.1 30S ribosomal protein THX [Myroides albus]